MFISSLYIVIAIVDSAVSSRRVFCCPSDCIPFATTYFMYDTMAAMSVPVKEELKINNAELGLLFSMYSIVSPQLCGVCFRGHALARSLSLQPNMFMPLIVGILSSREAVLWRMALLLVLGMTTGSALAAGGVIWKSLPLLAAGRLLSGYVMQ